MELVSKYMLEILDEIALRPGMYIGSDIKSEQLRNLAWVLLGSQVALRKVIPEGEDFLGKLALFLRELHGCSAGLGPVAAAKEIGSGDADRAWAVFWDSVEAFRKHLQEG